MFCGFPMGVSAEPVFAAIASKIINLPMSFFMRVCSVNVSGTIINKEMSFVKKADKISVSVTSFSASTLSLEALLTNRFVILCRKQLSATPVVIR